MSDYIIGRAMELPILIAEKHDIPEEELVEGLSFTYEDCLGSVYRRVPWSDFACYLKRLDAAIDADLADETATVFVTQRPFKSFIKIGGLFCSPKLYYWMANHCFAPLMFPLLTREVEELSAREIRITSRLPAHVEESPQFFEISGATLRVGPTTMGMKEAHVRSQPIPNGMIYTIKYPPSLSLIARGRRMLDAALSSQDFMDELMAQGKSLSESYRALQKSEESFRTLVENSPEAILIFRDDETLFANDALASLLGWEAGEDLRDISVSSLQVQSLNGDKDIRSMTRSSSPETVALKAKDGHLVQVEASSIEADFMGQKVCVSLMRDVSFRNEIMARAMDMDRLITTGTLAAGISHEINNPITYAQGNLIYVDEELRDFLAAHKDLIEPEDTEDLLAAITACREGVERAAEITKDLKNVGRDTSEHKDIIDLRDAVHGALRWARSDLMARAQLVLELQECGPVCTNTPRVNQVVLNLLLNAIQAIEPDRPRDNEIRIVTRTHDSKAIVEIHDTGCGIPPKRLERIFEPFYTTKPSGEGTGLGLFISRDILERLGGSLTIESEVGQGTVARISFPLSEKARPTKPSVAQAH